MGRILRQALSAPGLAAMSAVVIHNDTVLWTGNFGKKNGSDPASGPPNEYTIYRSAGGPPGSCGRGEGWDDEGDLGGRRTHENYGWVRGGADLSYQGPFLSFGNFTDEETEVQRGTVSA